MMSRAFDMAVLTAALVLLSPIWLLAAACVKLYDGGPVLYKAQRVGKDGRLFTAYKFRTMVPDAQKLGAKPDSDRAEPG